MLATAIFTDFSRANRPSFRRGAVGLTLAAAGLAGAGALGWLLPGPALVMLLGCLLFSAGFVAGRGLERRARRAPQAAAVAPVRPAGYARYQPQEIRCNPFFELVSSPSL